MNPVEWKVEVGADQVSAEYEPATSPAEGAVFALAHGAGGNMSDRGVLATAKVLRANGFGVVRFNFPYKERKSGRPDPMSRLTETVAAVVAHIRRELEPARVIIGGRSMGGRAASMLAATRFPADGLLLLAYPLHPAGQPGKLRDAHLAGIGMPVLCINGTRDALCSRDLMERAVATVQCAWRMHWVDGADHSFHVLKSSGRTDAAVMEEIGRTAADWLSGLSSPG